MREKSRAQAVRRHGQHGRAKPEWSGPSIDDETRRGIARSSRLESAPRWNAIGRNAITAGCSSFVRTRIGMTTQGFRP